MKIGHIIAIAALALTASSAQAVRYQPNALYRIYYTDASKWEIAGEAILGCPTYTGLSSDGWYLLEGEETPWFVEHVGEKCDNGPVTGLPCYSNPCPAGTPPLGGLRVK